MEENAGGMLAGKNISYTLLLLQLKNVFFFKLKCFSLINLKFYVCNQTKFEPNSSHVGSTLLIRSQKERTNKIIDDY